MQPLFEPQKTDAQWVAAPSQSESRETKEQIRRDAIAQQVNQLLTTLGEEALKRKKKRKNAASTVTIYFTIIVGLMLVATLASGKFPPGLLGLFGSMTAVMAGAFAVSQRHKEATQKIAQFDDVRAVGPLLDALDFQDKKTSEIAEQALIRLLPRLNASHSRLLSAEQYGLLIKAIHSKRVPVAVAAVTALEQIGDEKALPIVGQLARGEGRAAREPALQQAAMDCLPALTVLAERKRAGAELLRAANGNVTQQGVLLRPALPSQSGENPAFLLRAEPVNREQT